MRLQRIAMMVLVVTVAVFAAGQVASTQPASAPSSQASSDDQLTPEQIAQAQKLIGELSADEWKTREDAHAKLREMGPAIFSVLVAHRGDADQETAARIDALIKEYSWLTRGAVVVHILPTSAAEKLGIKLGDVLVKIQDVEIANTADIRKVRNDGPRVFTFMRGGKIIKVDAPAGILGFESQDWELLNGGQTFLKALQALSEKKYALVDTMFAQAKAEGRDIPPPGPMLAGCLEYQLDHAKAMEVYSAFKGNRPNCADSHSADLDPSWSGLPINNLHTAFLLEQMKASDDEDTYLLHQLDSWFTGAGRNMPLARTILEKEWSPAMVEQATPSYINNHVQAKQKLAMADRRWKDAIQIANDHQSLYTAEVAIQAAVEAHDVDEAAHKAYFLITDGIGNTIYKGHTYVTLALAAAVMADRQDLFDSILTELGKANPEQLNSFLATNYCYALDTRALDEKFLPALRKLAQRTNSDELNWLILRRAAVQPGLTLDQWNEAMDKFGRHPNHPNMFDNVDVLAHLRLGDFAYARKAFERWKTAVPENGCLRAVNLLESKKALLAGPWAPLVGTVAVFGDSKSGNGVWAIRYDGQVFSIDENDNIRHYDGIDEFEPCNPWEAGIVIAYSTGVVLVRQNQVYLLDSQAGRWVPIYAASGAQKIDWKMWDTAVTAPTLRFVMEHYPSSGPGRELMLAGWFGKWRWSVFSGDIGIVTRRDQYAPRDLSKEIAALAGKDTPVAVYKPAVAGQTLVIPTNCGLWLMDADGKITPAELPMDNRDVMTEIMSWPVADGKLYVGVVPQQGGQVFEMDIASRQFRLTGGFCGLGPQDAYSEWGGKTPRMAQGYSLMSLYHKSHPGAASGPASQPATKP